MVGQKLRDARQSQHLSLTQVATKARMSAATLSRIENGKQALDVDTLFLLARILGASPEELVSNGGRPSRDAAPLVDQITSLTAQNRARLWRDLASRRKRLVIKRESADLDARIEELVAQVELLRQEIAAVRRQKKR